MFTTRIPAHIATDIDDIATHLHGDTYRIDTAYGLATGYDIRQDADGTPTHLILRTGGTYPLTAITDPPRTTRPLPLIGNHDCPIRQAQPSNPRDWAWAPEQRTDLPELHRRLDAYSEYAAWSYGRIAYLEGRLKQAGIQID